MKFKGLLALLSLISFLFFLSCTKVNEATDLGDDLIPAIDNVNTFDTTLEVSAAYFPFEDSSRHLFGENMALGRINDPVFGTTTADMFFNLSSTIYSTHPFKDTVVGIDSIVLSLAYAGAYGDTLSQLDVAVSEINLNNGFNDTTLYRFDQSEFSTGTVLGNKTFSPHQFNDSFQIRSTGRRNDTVKVANVLRIPLNNSLAAKLRAFDITTSPLTGGYNNDSLFRTLFRGLGVKTISSTSSGALAYFNPANTAGSVLTIYYRSSLNGVKDTTTVTYTHRVYSQANSIKRTAGGEYLAKKNDPNPQKLYVQSSPTGSYVGIRIPGLDAFPNKVIHRAELIAYKVPADNPLGDAIFSPPVRLLLDHKGANNSKDSAYLFDNDIQPGTDGSLNFTAFGGTLRTDDSYRFNLTRYVQGIVTRKDRNDSLRLFAPLRSILYSKSLGQVISVSALDNIAKGRVIIANNNFSDRNRRLRLRVIYSNL